jgi:hypothetical protein
MPTTRESAQSVKEAIIAEEDKNRIDYLGINPACREETVVALGYACTEAELAELPTVDPLEEYAKALESRTEAVLQSQAATVLKDAGVMIAA